MNNPRSAKIIIACDSFKGSLSSSSANCAVRDGILETLNSLGVSAEIRAFAIGDGGEGTSAALSETFKARPASVRTVGPLGNPVTATYAISADGRTAIMDMAAAAGLTLVPEGRLDPLAASTRGVGTMLLDAASRGCREIIIGLGGSATTDAGTGMLATLGYLFLDAEGNILESCGASLQKIVRILPPSAKPLEGIKITAACDVRNPLFGSEGAAYVFAPQKGADPMQLEELDRGLRNFAAVSGGDYAFPGAGAAGGLGFALRTFLDADLCPGIDLVLSATGFTGALDGATMVITGEGRFDAQSLMGKATGGIMRLANIKNVPVAILAGKIDDRNVALAGQTHAMLEITPPDMPLEQALEPETAVTNLRQAAKRLIHTLFPSL